MIAASALIIRIFDCGASYEGILQHRHTEIKARILEAVQELFVAATSSPYLLATKQRMAAISFGVCTGRLIR